MQETKPFRPTRTGPKQTVSIKRDSGYTIAYRRDKTPEAQLHRNPTVRSEVLADKLGRKLCTQKGQLEDGLAESYRTQPETNSIDPAQEP
ncbi:hypothetical protein LB504_005297 [Fusarium proliferatum]|nr:hypothetical protein LB504_005297 [Fusarium proliferatum]